MTATKSQLKIKRCVESIASITLDTIAKEWDINVEERAREFELGIDETYRKVIQPTIIRLLNAYHLESHHAGIDVGCGLGYLCDYLDHQGLTIEGIDISERSITYARKRFPHLHFSQSDIETFANLNGQRFDYCVANMVAHNLVDLSSNFQALNQLLRNRGILLVSIPHPIFWLDSKNCLDPDEFDYLKETCFKLDFKIRAGNVHKSAITYIHRPLSRYINMIQECGFQIEHLVEASESQSRPYPDLFFMLFRKNSRETSR